MIRGPAVFICSTSLTASREMHASPSLWMVVVKAPLHVRCLPLQDFEHMGERARPRCDTEVPDASRSRDGAGTAVQMSTLGWPSLRYPGRASHGPTCHRARHERCSMHTAGPSPSAFLCHQNADGRPGKHGWRSREKKVAGQPSGVSAIGDNVGLVPSGHVWRIENVLPSNCLHRTIWDFTFDHKIYLPRAGKWEGERGGELENRIGMMAHIGGGFDG